MPNGNAVSAESSPMRTLLTRAVSALVAVGFVTLLAYFGGGTGMRLLTLIAVTLSIREFTRMVLTPVAPFLHSMMAAGFILLSFLSGLLSFETFPAAIGLYFTVFLIIGVAQHKSFPSLENLAQFQTRGALGFFYLGLMPVMASRLIDLENGVTWFLALMGFVFAGDTFAYLAGSRLGKRLLMPQISPKKSLEGAMGGLAGSALAALIFSPFLPHVPLLFLIGLSLLAGVAGQMGDFFESMLKRVANQKDSGTLMPGHGGVLDRIDGVLFASPVMLAGASLLENWF